MEIKISEPLSNSEIGYETFHDIILNGKNVGQVSVQYVTKDDVKSFKRSKRKMKVGQPFCVRICIDATKGGMKISDIGKDRMLQVVEAVKKRFQGLEEKDIGILELCNGRKNIIGNVSNL